MEPTATAIFSYQAQTDEGLRLSGTIDAGDAESAMERLQALRLRVVELSPAAPVRGKAIRGDAFLAFNQQLAQLTAAGLPVEQGLRLIAADVRSGRLARTIRQVAEELERGVPLAWQVLRSTGREGGIVERLVMPLPLVGPVLRFALVARWCDAARLAVSAGLDLPAAIEMAADATGSKGLAEDGREMISLLS